MIQTLRKKRVRGLLSMSCARSVCVCGSTDCYPCPCSVFLWFHKLLSMSCAMSMCVCGSTDCYPCPVQCQCVSVVPQTVIHVLCNVSVCLWFRRLLSMSCAMSMCVCGSTDLSMSCAMSMCVCGSTDCYPRPVQCQCVSVVPQTAAWGQVGGVEGFRQQLDHSGQHSLRGGHWTS